MTPLESGDLLQWFRIERVLGKGGFGITYLATDTNLDHYVAIKEYAPDLQVERAPDQSLQPVSTEVDDSYQTGLTRFISEARTLVKFNHPNIVRILTVFSENNTAYLVMDFEEGEVFSDYVRSNYPVSETRLKEIFSKIIDGLTQVHAKGFLHRDIKPGNLIIRQNGDPVLLDFGCARPSLLPDTNTQTAFVSPGYTPLEQFQSIAGLEEGPWTDIYALSATLYFSISTKTPTNSASRLSALSSNIPDPMASAEEIGANHYSSGFLQAIDWGLKPTIADRPQSLSQWLNAVTTESPQYNDETVLFARPPTSRTNHTTDADTVILPPSHRTQRTAQSAYRPQTNNSEPVAENPHLDRRDFYRHGETTERGESAPWDERAPTRHEFSKRPEKSGPGIVAMSSLTLVLLLCGAGGYFWYKSQPVTTDSEANAPAEDLAISSTPATEQPTQTPGAIEQIEKLLGNAKQDADKGEWLSAAEFYKQVQDADAGNRNAEEGLKDLGNNWLLEIDQSISNDQLQTASASIQDFETIFGSSEKLEQIKNGLLNAQEARKDALAEQQRKQAKLAEQREQAELVEQRKQAELAEQRIQAELAEQRKQAELAEQQRIQAELAEQRKQAELAEQQRKQAELAEQRKQAELDEQRKQAELAEQREQAELAEQRKQAELAEQRKQAELDEQRKQAELDEQRKQAELAEQRRQAELDVQRRQTELDEQRKQAELDEQRRQAELDEQRRQAELAEQRKQTERTKQQNMAQLNQLLSTADRHLNEGNLAAANLALSEARSLQIDTPELSRLSTMYNDAVADGQKPQLLNTVDAIREADSRFQKLARAVMNRNERAVDLLTEGDDQKLALLRSIFGKYKQIEVEISNLERTANQNAITAILSIERLSLPDGTTTIPASSWRHHSINLEYGENGWSKIRW